VGPVELSWSHVFGDWQTDTIAWVGIGLEVLSALLYMSGVRRVARTGRSWPISRTLSFFGGLVALAFVLQTGFASYDDDLLWVHMTQHLVIMMLAAPLLALGAPVRLTLVAGSRGVRRVMADLLHDPSLKLVGGRSAGVLLPLDYYGSMAIYTLTPLYRLSETNTGFHEFIHIYFLACGLLFWVPLLGADPATWRPSHRLKVAVLAIGVPAYLAICGGMLAEGQWISSAHTVSDIHRGILAMAIGGVGLTLAGLLLVTRRDGRRQADRDRRIAAATATREAAPRGSA
jgi:putative copper resistance protein D